MVEIKTKQNHILVDDTSRRPLLLPHRNQLPPPPHPPPKPSPPPFFSLKIEDLKSGSTHHSLTIITTTPSRDR
ncbi:hypothetical protein P8452_24227 [Trifolium repens]|nr:hypothetical protein P8452_24227 [Trifolium repens]